MADGDRRHPYQRVAGSHYAQAGLRHHAAARRRAGDPGREGQRGPTGPGRVPRPEEAVAGDLPHALGRRRALRVQLLLQVRAGHVLRGRRRAPGRRRLLLAAGPDRRRDERVGAPAVDDRAGVGARGARGGGGGRGGRGARRPDGPDAACIRDPQVGIRAVGRARLAVA